MLAALVQQIDEEMTTREPVAAQAAQDGWEGLLADAAAHIELALKPEVRRIVLLDGPVIFGDPSLWQSQNACVSLRKTAIASLVASGVMKPANVEAAARLLNSAARNAALWLALSDQPDLLLPCAIETYWLMASGSCVIQSDTDGVAPAALSEPAASHHRRITSALIKALEDAHMADHVDPGIAERHTLRCNGYITVLMHIGQGYPILLCAAD